VRSEGPALAEAKSETTNQGEEQEARGSDLKHFSCLIVLEGKWMGAEFEQSRKSGVEE